MSFLLKAVRSLMVGTIHVEYISYSSLFALDSVCGMLNNHRGIICTVYIQKFNMLQLKINGNNNAQQDGVRGCNNNKGKETLY